MYDHIEKNALGLHALDMRTLITAMTGYYSVADTIQDFIDLMKEA